MILYDVIVISVINAVIYISIIYSFVRGIFGFFIDNKVVGCYIRIISYWFFFKFCRIIFIVYIVKFNLN